MRQRRAAAELRARESQIRSYAATIYDELWNEILGKLSEANEKGGPPEILTNGAPYQRKLFVPQIPKKNERGSNPKEYVFALADNQQSITLTGPQTKEILILDLGEDRVVYIKHNGERKNIPEAVRSLLRPLLFPDLYRPLI